MTATCELCGVTVMGKYVAIDPDDTRQRQAEYDNLAAHMWLHICDFHREHMEGGILCQRRAAKLYAMRWALTGAELVPVEREWRATLLVMMVTTARYEGQAPAAGAPLGLAGGAVSTGASSESAPSASASNEKNESRKPSI